MALNDGTTIKNLQIVFDLARFPDEIRSRSQPARASMCRESWWHLQAPASWWRCRRPIWRCTALPIPPHIRCRRRGIPSNSSAKAHLRPRTNTFGAVLRIRHALAFAVHKFLTTKGFCYFHTPLITASDCEGAGAMFQVTTLPLENLPRLRMAAWTIRGFLRPSGQSHRLRPA